MNKFVTTPIYYVNDVPHIGHAYTTILCDIFKKSHILRGNSCYLLTGTDEHGQKIENAASSGNKSIEEYTNAISATFRNLWNEFGIDYNYFVRTTDKNHELGVQNAFEVMFKKGDIYKGQYEGHYCVSCETFWTKTQLIGENACPDCKKATSPLKEESYFFALSKYEKKLLEWYENNPDVIVPSYRKNEIVNFIKGGLSDLSITRSSFKWGISLPESINDTKHVIYVWLDALLSYITPLGYGSDGVKLKFMEDMTHFVGKDILRFHAIYWIAFLMSLDLPLPKRIYAHGWWLHSGTKMSKSLGNVINPKEVAETYGVEILRYFLSREVPFGQDGDYSTKALVQRANSELSDTLGNLLSRLFGMSEKYFNCEIASQSLLYERKIAVIIDEILPFMDEMSLNRYLDGLWKLFDMANATIAKTAPWELMKQGKDNEVQDLLIFVANVLAKGALLLYPIMPKSSKKIMECLGVGLNDYKKLIVDGGFVDKFNIKKIPPLFPKFDEITQSPQEAESSPKSDVKDEINIKHFDKVDIRVGKILNASKVDGSEKLLKFELDFGESVGVRQIISGIAKFYEPNELIGVSVCAIVNLKPSKIFGNLSEGMLLTSEDSKGNVRLLSIPSEVESGSKIG